jgi:hypothetical protein
MWRHFWHPLPPPSELATGVANHPQSLWITLWMASRGIRQVALPKDFFFDRPFFERKDNIPIIQ